MGPAPPRAANEVANPVDDRLPDVGLQPSHRSMLETLDVFDGPQEHVLDDVFRVGVASRVARQSSARPLPNRRQSALDQDLCGRLITTLRALEDMQR